MGISYKTFCNKRTKKLEELKEYANFNVVHGGVDITHIEIPVYISSDDAFDAFYLSEVRNDPNGLSTAAGAARKLIQFNPKYKSANERTTRYKMSLAANRCFGKINRETNISTMGTHGTREHEWVIKLDDYNHHRPLDAEELKIFTRIRDEWAAG